MNALHFVSLEDVKAYFDDVLKGIVKDEPLLTRRDAAEFCQVSPTTITNWVKAGTIKHLWIGNQPYFKKSDLLNHYKEQL